MKITLTEKALEGLNSHNQLMILFMEHPELFTYYNLAVSISSIIIWFLVFRLRSKLINYFNNRALVSGDVGEG